MSSPVGSPNGPKKWLAIDQLEDDMFDPAKRTADDRKMWLQVRRRMDADRRIRNAPRNFKGQDVDTWEWLPDTSISR